MPCIVKGRKARHIQSEGFKGFCLKTKEACSHLQAPFYSITVMVLELELDLELVLELVLELLPPHLLF